MRAPRALSFAVAFIALVAWSSRSAQAAYVTYVLDYGQLTSVTTNGVEVLAAPEPLTNAEATIDFDPAVLEMSNLFVEAGSLATLQSRASASLTYDLATGQYVLGDAPVDLTGDLFGSGLIGNAAGSTIAVTGDGLQMSMTGVGVGGGGPLLPVIKVDFFFVAASTQPGASPIPEPGSDLLLPAGLALLGLIFRTQRAKAVC